jgi:hypothetical protein
MHRSQMHPFFMKESFSATATALTAAEKVSKLAAA